MLRALRTNSFFTMLRTWLRGELVGEDEYGNRYYRERGSGRSWRDERRWVVFASVAEPTMVPPGWVGWLHKRIEQPPSQRPLPAPKWEREPLPNLTGTEQAYLPPGAIQRGGQRAPATGDYEAWRPELIQQGGGQETPREPAAPALRHPNDLVHHETQQQHPVRFATLVQLSDLHLSHKVRPGTSPTDPELPWVYRLAAGEELGSLAGRAFIEFAKLVRIAGHLPGLLAHHQAALAAIQTFVSDLRRQLAFEREPVVVVTGDLTCNGARPAFELCHSFIAADPPSQFNGAGLKFNKWKNYAVLGNHDWWPGRDTVVGSWNRKFKRNFMLLPHKDSLSILEFMRLNTDRDVGAFSGDRIYARGKFNSDLVELGNSTRDSKIVRVLVMHHSPSHCDPRGQGQLQIDEGTAHNLSQFIVENEVAVVLSGHIHIPKLSRHEIQFAGRDWSYVEARCGTSAMLNEIPDAVKTKLVENGYAGPLEIDCGNVIMTHSLVEREGQVVWQVRTHFFNSSEGTFGAPDGVDGQASVQELNADFVIGAGGAEKLSPITGP